MFQARTSSFFLYSALACIGFANAVPLPLIGSTLSIWLTETGFSSKTIGLCALLTIPFSLKILWSPIIDLVRPPLFSDAPRKGWLLIFFGGMASSLALMGVVDPLRCPWLLGVNVFLLSFWTGGFYIAGLSYELESVLEFQYRKASSIVLTSYRLGLLVGGGGALYLSLCIGWSAMFLAMAFVIFLSSCVIFYLPEPRKSDESLKQRRLEFSRYPSLWNGMCHELFIVPFRLLFTNPKWLFILCSVLLFKIGDQMKQNMQGPFYLSLGFDKSEIADACKFWGMVASIGGALAGGFFLKKQDSFLFLWKMGAFHAVSLFSLYFLSIFKKSIVGLYGVVAFEHATGGMAMAAFISFLWQVCGKSRGSILYALLWSLFSLKGDLVSCLGGFCAFHLSWGNFFLLTACIGIGSSFFMYKFAQTQKQVFE